MNGKLMRFKPRGNFDHSQYYVKEPVSPVAEPKKAARKYDDIDILNAFSVGAGLMGFAMVVCIIYGA
jgi:hypothetical protein